MLSVSEGSVDAMRSFWDTAAAIVLRSSFRCKSSGEGSSPADFDLPHVRDRVETLGGKFMIDRASAGGTRVAAAIPLPYEGPLSAR